MTVKTKKVAAKKTPVKKVKAMPKKRVPKKVPFTAAETENVKKVLEEQTQYNDLLEKQILQKKTENDLMGKSAVTELLTEVFVDRMGGSYPTLHERYDSKYSDNPRKISTSSGVEDEFNTFLGIQLEEAYKIALLDAELDSLKKRPGFFSRLFGKLSSFWNWLTNKPKQLNS